MKNIYIYAYGKKSAFHFLRVKYTLLFLCFFCLLNNVVAQVFSENMGSPASTTAINAYTGWQNNATLTFTGSGDVRTSTPSSGYTGASGSGNVYLTNTIGQDFQISGINTIGLSGFVLSFGLYKSTIASDATECVVEISTDGVAYSAVSFPAQPTGSGTAIWRLLTITGGAAIPATANLRIRFTNTSASVQFRIDDVLLNYSKYYRSQATADWDGATTWTASPDGIAPYIATAQAPNSNDSKVEIMNTHTVTVSNAAVSFKNCFIKSGAILQLATNSPYTIGGTGTNLTVESGGNLLLNFPSTSVPAAIAGTGTCLVKNGGKVTANNNSFAGFGAALGDNYLGTGSKFTYEHNAVFDWKVTSTTLSSSGSESYFNTTAATDVPVFRISNSPAFAYGSSGTNTFNCILEANANYAFTGSGTKTFRGGFSGTATITQNAGSGQLIIGSASVVPLLNGTITLNISANGLSLVNGVTVPVTTGNMIISQSSGGAISKSSGVFTINGIINLTDVLVSNASGSVIISGTLKTGNSNGLSGSGTATITSGLVTINSGSTVEYNRGGAQLVTNQYNHHHIIFSGSGTKTLAGNTGVLGDLTITGGVAVLALSSFNVNLSGNWTNYNATGLNEQTGMVDFNGAAAQSINTGGGENFYIFKKSGAGTLTLNSNVRVDGGGSSNVLISAGILDAGLFTFDGSASTIFNMSGGTLKQAKLNTTLPEFPISPAYNITGGTIELNGAGIQNLRGGRDYRNLSFTNSGTKGITSAISNITGTILVANTVILDVLNNTMGGSGTNLTMTGTAVYKTAGSFQVKPDAQGTYTLAAGTTVEFTNNAGGLESVRLSPDYYHIVVSGSSVGTSTLVSGIKFQAGGSFTVKNGAVFKLENSNGFSGAANTSVSNTNNPTIVLETGSTIEYNGTDQTITNQVIPVPADANYTALVLSNSGTKTAPAGNLTIRGNLTKSGITVFAHNNGTVIFNGIASQSYNASDPVMEFYNLSNNNTVDLSINNNLSVYRTLAFGINARLNLEDGNISLRSNAAGTANVGIIPANAVISYSAGGRFIIERYIPSGVSHGKSWQFLAVPANGGQTIQAGWQEGDTYPTSIPGGGLGTIISNNTAGAGFDIIGGVGPSMKTFDPAGAGSWVGVPNTAATTLYNQKGYMLFVRGDRTVTTVSDPAKPTTLRTTGKIFAPVSNLPPVNNAGADEYLSIGNPYASAIDFSNDAAVIKSANIQKVFYVWDPKLGGIYGFGGFQTFVKGVDPDNNYYVSPGGGSYGAGGSVNNSIQSGQAFLVRSFGGTGTVNVTENAKISGSSPVFRGMPEVNTVKQTRLRTNLLDGNAEGATLVDGVLSEYDRHFSNNIDPLDAIKQVNFGENFALTSNGQSLTVERRALITRTDTLFYHLEQMQLKDYQFEFIPENFYKKGLHAYLEDAYLNRKTAISLNESSRISFAISRDAGSADANRFRLVFMQGKKVGQFPEDQPEFANTTETQRVTVFPNPVSGSTFNILFRGETAGNCRVKLVSPVGRILIEKEFMLTGNGLSKKLNIPGLTPGIYQLQTVFPDGTKNSQPVLIK